MYKAFFVDIDNTILDFEAYVVESLKSGFVKYELGDFEPWMIEVFHRENDKLWRALERKELTLDELMAVRFNKVFEALGVEFDGVKFEEYFRKALWDSAILVDGARELLEGLAQKYVVCAASNGPYEQQVHRLEICGLLGLFDYLFISQDIGVNKPAVEFFEEAFRRLNAGRGAGAAAGQETGDGTKDAAGSEANAGEGKRAVARKLELFPDLIKPEECVMLGDSMTSDMAGGRNYGMHNVFFSRGKAKPAGSDEPGNSDADAVTTAGETGKAGSADAADSAGGAGKAGGADAENLAGETGKACGADAPVWDDWCTTLKEVHQKYCK